MIGCCQRVILSGSIVVATAIGGAVRAASPDSSERGASAARGYQWLATRAYLPPDFEQETFDALWQEWEPALREQARRATPEERRRMAFARYGLTGPPEVESGMTPGDAPGAKTGRAAPASKDSNSEFRNPNLPAQYVVDAQGNWTMSCLACHQGRVAGRTIPGVPNTGFALATLTEEIRAVKLRREKPMSRMDVGSLFLPLGTTRGTTNAVMFGVVLMNYRDADLGIHPERPRPPMVHHDLDAPAWWHYHKKQRLYYDGFVPKNHRALMQFLMVQENGPEKFREWENEFRDIEAWIDALRPPKYPFAIDRQLAATGQRVFNRSCASCHGTHGEHSTYPNRMVPLEQLGTDPVRLSALAPEHRAAYAASWFNGYGRQPVETRPKGYVAPPLDGIWASAPYFHNGSVPTLWHVLHSAQRPTVWRRIPEGRELEIEGYDHEKVGLRTESRTQLPVTPLSLRERREYFDTRKRGKSAAGHTFPDRLSDPDKAAVLEYLKTL